MYLILEISLLDKLKNSETFSEFFLKNKNKYHCKWREFLYTYTKFIISQILCILQSLEKTANSVLKN